MVLQKRKQCHQNNYILSYYILLFVFFLGGKLNFEACSWTTLQISGSDSGITPSLRRVLRCTGDLEDLVIEHRFSICTVYL